MFELVNNGGGAYTPTTLLSFNDANGAVSVCRSDRRRRRGPLRHDSEGGADGDGTVFELVNNGGGDYTPTTLFSFNGANGGTRIAGLIADAAGDLFGTTEPGGTNNDWHGVRARQQWRRRLHAGHAAQFQRR